MKCVVIDTRLGELDPRALDFVVNFAKDNSLPIEEACEFELPAAAGLKWRRAATDKSAGTLRLKPRSVEFLVEH